MKIKIIILALALINLSYGEVSHVIVRKDGFALSGKLNDDEKILYVKAQVAIESYISNTKEAKQDALDLIFRGQDQILIDDFIGLGLTLRRSHLEYQLSIMSEAMALGYFRNSKTSSNSDVYNETKDEISKIDKHLLLISSRKNESKP